MTHNPYSSSGGPKKYPLRSRYESFGKYKFLAAIARREAANRQGQATEHRSNERSMRRSTVAIAWLTLILALVGVASAGFSGLQWRVIRDQLDEMRAEQRPWAKVSASAIPFPPVEFGGDFPAAIPIGLTIRNVGHSPMFNIRPRMWAFVAGLSGNDPIASWKRDCEKFRGGHGSGWDKGNILFPDDKFPPPIDEPAGPLVPSVSKTLVENVKPGKDGERTIGIYVYGCVNYAFSGETTNHQTRFLFRVWRNKTGAVTDFQNFNLGEPVPYEQFKFLPGPGGGPKPIRFIRLNSAPSAAAII